MTRAEYEAKYGVSPVASTAPIKMTRAEYEAKYGAVQQPSAETSSLTASGAGSLPVIKQLTQFGAGLGSTLGQTGLGLGQTFLKGANVVGNVLGTPTDQYNPLIKGIEDIKQKLYIEPVKKELISGFGQAGEITGQGAAYLAPSGLITKSQKAITGVVNTIPAITRKAQFLRGALGVAGRALPEAIGAGGASLAITGGDTEEAKRNALLAGGISTVFGSLGSLYRGAKDTGIVKSVLSKTTGIPKGAFDEIATGNIKNVTPETALATGRESIKQLRQNITKTWQDRLPVIAETYKGQRIGLSKNQITKLSKVINEFDVDPKYIPQNLNNMSAIESINLIKGLNELDSLAVKASPKGSIVRALRPELRSKIIDSFGGKTGEISKLWKDYSVKIDILNNANSIINAYGTKPQQIVTAKNRLMAIFDENKPEFLKAIKDLEFETGTNIVKQVAGTKFQNILPDQILKATGGLPTKSSIIDRLIQAILLPITSPRLAAKLATPLTEEGGLVSKRVFGNYLPERNSLSNQSTVIDQITPQTPKINSNIDIPPTIPQIESNVKGITLPNKQGGFIQTGFKNEGDLTTKILKDLEGKTTVSKQYILDATNRGELKQVERDITRQVLDTMPDGQINVKEFADKVKSELLPLTRTPSNAEFKKAGVGSQTKYESITLPSEIRGNVKNYDEHIYNSPIETSAGKVHFGADETNYFGHTRIEDMADNQTRRVIEVQSDLYQKGNLEKELDSNDFERLREATNHEKAGNIKTAKKIRDEVKVRQDEISKLQQYNDPTAHFRMVREEIKKASQDGKTKLQFPTGETAMKIEGLGQADNGFQNFENGRMTTLTKPQDLATGKEVIDRSGSKWIITDILGDGKFKAVPKDNITTSNVKSLRETGKMEADTLGFTESAIESFDISGKVDTNNPIYKFYEKDVQKYLNKFGGKRIVDDKGVSWVEIPITKEQGKAPVEAFGKIKANPLLIGAGVGAGAVFGKAYLDKKQK